jgi:hypothetical protein
MADESLPQGPWDAQLDEAQQELERLQEMVAELPEIMEARFRQQLRDVQQRNQALVIEQLQLAAQLQQSSRRHILAVGRLSLILSFFLSCGVAAALAWSISFKPSPPTQIQQPNKLPAGIRLAVPGDTQSVIDLEASAPSWIEVKDHKGEVLLTDTLVQGGQRRIRLRNGLRLFAARPEHVRYRVDEGAWKLFPESAGDQFVELVPTSP